MKAVSRALIAYACWWGACTGQIDGQDSVQVVSTGIAKHVLREWALLYREFRTEFLQCLYGRSSGDSLKIHLALNAHVRPSQSTVKGVTPEDEMCPWALGLDSIVGVVHSHPRQERQALNGEREPPGDAWQSDSVARAEYDSARRAWPGDPFARFIPQLDPRLKGNLCYESWDDIALFMQNVLPVSVVVCGVGRIYVLRRGQTPNDGTNVCEYDPDANVPALVCGKLP